MSIIIEVSSRFEHGQKFYESLKEDKELKTIPEVEIRTSDTLKYGIFRGRLDLIMRGVRFPYAEDTYLSGEEILAIGLEGNPARTLKRDIELLLKVD